MSKEYERIRTEVSRRYKSEIQDLKSENKSLKAELEHYKSEMDDYEKLKVKYLKLIYYCKLSDEEREAVLNNSRVVSGIDDLVSKYGNFLASNFGQILRHTAEIMDGSLSFDSILGGDSDEGS